MLGKLLCLKYCDVRQIICGHEVVGFEGVALVAFYLAIYRA